MWQIKTKINGVWGVNPKKFYSTESAEYLGTRYIKVGAIEAYEVIPAQ